MKFGLNESEYQFIVDTIVRPLASKGAVVFCFGSRARGTHQKYSDLDLMVENPSNMDLDLGSIQETLSKSSFPYKVDLVSFSDFATAYLDQYQIEKVKF